MSDFTTYRWWYFYYVRVPTIFLRLWKWTELSKDTDTRENKHEPSLSNLCFHLHFFVIFNAMSNIDKNSHCSTDNRNVSCFLWEFCLLYMMWCLSTKMLKRIKKRDNQTPARVYFKKFWFWFFFYEKISVDFEFASLLLHLVGLSAGS